MKLYATVTSERASKGQGGNKYLTIKLQAGDDRARIIEMTFCKDTLDSGRVGYHLYDENGDTLKFWELKGGKHDPRTCENSVPCVDCELIEKGEQSLACG